MSGIKRLIEEIEEENGDIVSALETVLEFVERYNKQDAEKEVAEAAEVVQNFLTELANKHDYEQHKDANI